MSIQMQVIGMQSMNCHVQAPPQTQDYLFYFVKLNELWMEVFLVSGLTAFHIKQVRHHSAAVEWTLVY